MAYVNIDTAYDPLFDPSVINPPSLVRMALYDNRSSHFQRAGVVYRWLTKESELKGRVAYSQSASYVTDPWLEETLTKIAKFVDAPDNWDGAGSAAPNQELFSAAETVAEKFSAMPLGWRPIFNFDLDGLPNFTAHNDSIYLTVTVEDDHTISFYAVKDEVKLYRDEITLDEFNVNIFAEPFKVA